MEWSRRLFAILLWTIFLVEGLRLLFVKVKRKLNPIRLKRLLVRFKELFIIEQLGLKVFKRNHCITITIAECGNKGMVGGLETSNDIGDQVFIVNSLANGSKLIGQIFGYEEIISAGLGPLADCLQLAPEVGDPGARSGCKSLGKVCPNLLGSGESINYGQHFLRESGIKPGQYKLVLLLPYQKVWINGGSGFALCINSIFGGTSL
jgi:hypothetical protein